MRLCLAVAALIAGSVLTSCATDSDSSSGAESNTDEAAAPASPESSAPTPEPEPSPVDATVDQLNAAMPTLTDLQGQPSLIRTQCPSRTNETCLPREASRVFALTSSGDPYVGTDWDGGQLYVLAQAFQGAASAKRAYEEMDLGAVGPNIDFPAEPVGDGFTPGQRGSATQSRVDQQGWVGARRVSKVLLTQPNGSSMTPRMAQVQYNLVNGNARLFVTSLHALSDGGTARAQQLADSAVQHVINELAEGS